MRNLCSTSVDLFPQIVRQIRVFGYLLCGTFLNCVYQQITKLKKCMKLLMDILIVLGSVFLGYIVFMVASIALIKVFFPFFNQQEWEQMERNRLSKQNSGK
jgi:hypothetical protein